MPSDDLPTHALHGSEYANHSKEAQALVKKLRALGAQDELDLPRITVIGNQSAGKSSVVEAISGIKVPRDAGTCTRCPMECRLSHCEGEWSCQISIRHEFDEGGKRLSKVWEDLFGPRLMDKSEVEVMLRRAQYAVLNPRVSYEEALTIPEDQLRVKRRDTLQFSRNAVCIDLEGPELTDLSFIDLPGLIQNAEDHVIKLVEEMVVSHIRGNCIILVALPMTDDIENQKAMRLAQEVDPDGRRTIGAPTKPDMLTAGSTKARQMWLDIIEGRQHPLSLGYYCTRQPDDEARARNISSEEAREVEAEFFDTTAPWSTSVDKSRFGTNNLILRLSTLLIQVINDSLPRLRSETMRLLQTCSKELDLLPQAITVDPATHLLSLITDFASNFSGYVKGTEEQSELIQGNRKDFHELKLNIRSTAPFFVPVSRKSERAKTLLKSSGKDPVVGRALFLDDIQEHIRRSKTRELPHNVPWSAERSLIRAFQDSWPSHVETCFTTVQEAFSDWLFKTMQSTFARHAQLERYVKNLLETLLNKQAIICSKVLSTILNVELVPFTQNGHYYEASIEKWLGKYKQVKAGTADILDVRPRQPEEERVNGSAPDPGRTAALSDAGSAPLPNLPFSFSAIPAPVASKGAPGSSGFANTSSTFNLPTPSSTSKQPYAAAGTPLPAFGSGAFGGFAPATGATPLLSTSGNAAANGSASGGGSGGRKPIPRFDAIQPSPTAFTPSPPPFSPNPTPSPAPPQADGQPDPEIVNRILSDLASVGCHGLTFDQIMGKLSPNTEDDEALKVMADVRAYFQVAYKRMIDIIPGIIDLEFVNAVSKELQSYLIHQFDLGSPEGRARCEVLLAEERRVVDKRNKLQARQHRLLEVERELVKFGL